MVEVAACALVAACGSSGESSRTTVAERAQPASGAESTPRDESNDLNKKQLSKVVAANRPSMQDCYEEAIGSTGTQPTVRVQVRLTVRPDGTVQHAEANVDEGQTASEQVRQPLVDCLHHELARWSFPKAREETRTSFPVVFRPSK
jgi:hypothetical protein